MKRFVMMSLGLAFGLTLAATPVLASGKTGLGAAIGVSTGKGGVVGALLGGRGVQGIGVGAKLVSGKGGVLGLLLGSGNGGQGHGGHGSESALQHMRAWEQRRASHTGGNDSEGPD